MSFIIKVSYQNNVDAIFKKQVFTHDGIYNFKDEIKNGDTVFFYLGGDKSKISWEQGFVGYGKITREPYDVGYEKRYFKIDIEPSYVLDTPIPPKETKLHKKYQEELYDVPYVGANHFPNQAIAKVQDVGEKALFSILKLKEQPSQSVWNDSLPAISITSFNLSKPFLLLAGISGTGKTRFVREQAKTSGKFSETYCLTPVRPDWHEPSDLLGYISRLSQSGEAEYITTDVLKFIGSAWRGILDKGLTIEERQSEDEGLRLVVTGDKTQLAEVLPYWLCLDEMNLAPVEQYFADYLSVLETRDWNWDGDTFTYSSDALLKATAIEEISSEVSSNNKLRQDLGFEAADYDDVWELICKHGLAIPFNLIVAGTVNMDETTHGFSRKVIDRALSFDFGDFFPNDYDEFFTPSTTNKRLGYPVWSQANIDELADTIDPDGSKSVTFLKSVNEALKNTPFELAYRALNELLLAVISAQPEDDLSLKAVWDDFMMCKVLPRIEGDTDKLKTADDKEVLQELNSVLANQLEPIWNADNNNPTSQRPDLYRELKVTDDSNSDTTIRIACRSKAKLSWMSQRLEKATFTSFWP